MWWTDGLVLTDAIYPRIPPIWNAAVVLGVA
jgi:hypothetical protein